MILTFHHESHFRFLDKKIAYNLKIIGQIWLVVMYLIGSRKQTKVSIIISVSSSSGGGVVTDHLTHKKLHYLTRCTLTVANWDYDSYNEPVV